MPTLEEITLTKEQEELMVAMIADVEAADTTIKKLVRYQKHMKLIWDKAYWHGFYDGSEDEHNKNLVHLYK